MTLAAVLRHRLSVSLVLMVTLLLALTVGARAQALTAIDLGVDVEKADITWLGRLVEARGDQLQVETAVAADGTSGRMVVRAVTPGTSPNWFVFALKNPTDKPLERWIVADRYSHVGSGVIWPVLDARRIEGVTPSLGFVPERMPFDNADAFRLTVEPGQTVTYVMELAGDRLAKLQLWRGVDYEKRSRNRQLFQGILLGMAGLLAMFLTTVFAANHKAIFPSAALFTWCVVVYLCVDFGFWHKLFNVRPEENAQYRAAGEAAVVASLLIFAHTFLRLGRAHPFMRMLIGLAMIATLALVGLAFLDPRLAATFARLGLVGVLATSALVTAYLAVRGQDRALAIIPTWILFGVWVFGAAMVLTGRLQSDVIVNALLAGLVLLVMLIGFTVTQFAFRTIEPLFGASPDDQQMRALAIDSTGAAVFEWNAKREDVRLGPIVLASLGHKPEEIREPLKRFVERLNAADRDRLVQVLGGLKDTGKGIVQLQFRMRHVDGSDRWFELEGSGVATSERRMSRCIGLVREITDAKRTQERLLHDAVHDSLTNLPNRSLFLDRLGVAIGRARTEPLIRPAVFCIDLDRFKSVNSSFGVGYGDSVLMTVARRLARLAGPGDTIARIGGDQFAMILAQSRDGRELDQFGQEIRNAVKGVINIAGHDIVLTGSIGIAEFDVRSAATASDLISDAEIAMYRARRGGADSIERFTPQMRADKDDRQTIEDELRQAIERRQLTVLFQPIMYLRTDELAGFEAQVRWQHPRLGVLDPAAFVPLAEQSDLQVKLGSYILQVALAEALRWNTEFKRPGMPIFVSVNISSRQLFHPDMVAEIRHLLARATQLPKDALRLEITETLVMENPELATTILKEIAATGARLSLDDFGAGYSSLSYLTTFPFDTLKVDQALVHAATHSSDGTAVLRSIVALCHELGKTVVAEGTDTEEDAGLMRSLGCDHAQGVFCGEAMSPRDTMGVVKDMRRADKRRKGGGLFRLKSRRIEEDVEVKAAPDKKATGPAAPLADRDGAAPRRTKLRARPPQQGVPAAAAGQPPMASPAPPPVPPQSAPAQSMPPQSMPVAAALPQPPPMRVPPVPPPTVEPLPIDRSLSRLRAEIARAGEPTMRPAVTTPPPLPAAASRPAGADALSSLQSAIGVSPAPVAMPTAPDASPTPPDAPAAPAPRPRPVAVAPNLSTLPPAIAASLAKLAGVKAPVSAPEPLQPATGTDGKG